MLENPISILLAEDDDGHATLIQRNLRRLGGPTEVTRVRDGQEALDYVARRTRDGESGSRPPLVLVVDVNMPRVDGVEVLRTLKADPVTATIPVIMLTTADDPGDVDRCYQLGCAAYVTKPIPYEEFAESVKRLGKFLGIVRVPVGRAS